MDSLNCSLEFSSDSSASESSSRMSGPPEIHSQPDHMLLLEKLSQAVELLNQYSMLRQTEIEPSIDELIGDDNPAHAQRLETISGLARSAERSVRRRNIETAKSILKALLNHEFDIKHLTSAVESRKANGEGVIGDEREWQQWADKIEGMLRAYTEYQAEHLKCNSDSDRKKAEKRLMSKQSEYPAQRPARSSVTAEYIGGDEEQTTDEGSDGPPAE